MVLFQVRRSRWGGRPGGAHEFDLRFGLGSDGERRGGKCRRMWKEMVL